MRIFIYNILLFLSFFSLSVSVFGQDIIYKPVVIHQVTHEIDVDAICCLTLVKGKSSYKIDYALKVITLPDTGTYFLKNEYQEEDYGEIHITETGIIDTFYSPLTIVAICLCPEPATYHYSHNDEFCQGEIIDYYKNGTIRMTGKFKNGLPIRDLKYYYRNGNLKEREIPKKKLLFEYYETGELKKESNYKKHTYKEYYKSGELKSFRSYKNNKSTYQEYYKNGQLKYSQMKNSKVIYDEQGNVIDIEKLENK